SSHTVGPMRAALRFVTGPRESGDLARTARIRAELFGSLGATGHGHGSNKAVLLGLSGEDPETVDTDGIDAVVAQVYDKREVALLGTHRIPFDRDSDLVLHRRRSLPYHPNGMTFTSFEASGAELSARTYYSVGGGFVVDEAAAGAGRIIEDPTPVRFP